MKFLLPVPGILAATAAISPFRTAVAQVDLKYICHRKPQDCKQVCANPKALPAAGSRCPTEGLGLQQCKAGEYPKFCYTCDCSCPDTNYGDPPQLDDLSDWQPADYNHMDGLLDSHFLTHGYMFDSPMVLPPADGKLLFRADYKLTNTGTAFPRDGSSPGVPGAYPYDEGYEHWGGDEVKLGKQRYSSMISHFGHSHIMTVLAKMNLLRRDLCDETTSQDKMLDHLLDGSKQIFAWFAGLVDSDGNPTPDPTNPMKAQLKGLMSMLIYGDGTDEGVIDINVLFGALGQFIEVAEAGENPNLALLRAEAGRVQGYLGDLLKLAGPEPIPLMAWQQLMTAHQGSTVDNYVLYREAWGTGDADAMARMDAEGQLLIQSGFQMAAFFGVFYSFTNFLDKFYYTATDDEYAIPVAIMNENVNYVQEMLKWRWIEHTVMFNDYAKAAALDDEENMYQIQVNLLDSCTPLASTIGEVFSRFDKLMRGRDLFNADFWDMGN